MVVLHMGHGTFDLLLWPNTSSRCGYSGGVGPLIFHEFKFSCVWLKVVHQFNTFALKCLGHVCKVQTEFRTFRLPFTCMLSFLQGDATSLHSVRLRHTSPFTNTERLCSQPVTLVLYRCHRVFIWGINENEHFFNYGLSHTPTSTGCCV